MKHSILTLILLLLFSNCSEINTTEPNEVYRYWSGSNPPKNIKLINGQYWRSAHWTNEYVMSLKIKSDENWWNEFVSQNKLELDTTKWIKPSDLPKWFNPSNNSVRYKISGQFTQDSRYFVDQSTNECYIYEIQL